MKNIRIKSVLCAALATSSLYVGAQNLPSELLDASSDSLSVAEEELVQVAYRKVNKKRPFRRSFFCKCRRINEKGLFHIQFRRHGEHG